MLLDTCHRTATTNLFLLLLFNYVKRLASQVADVWFSGSPVTSVVDDNPLSLTVVLLGLCGFRLSRF